MRVALAVLFLSGCAINNGNINVGGTQSNTYHGAPPSQPSRSDDSPGYEAIPGQSNRRGAQDRSTGIALGVTSSLGLGLVSLACVSASDDASRALSYAQPGQYSSYDLNRFASTRDGAKIAAITTAAMAGSLLAASLLVWALD